MTKVKSQIQRLTGKRTVKTLFVAFLIYCAVTCVFHYFAFIHPHAENTGVEHFKDLTVALWANVIFAGTFGLLAAIMSLIKPEEDSLDKRLGYLYPRSSTLSGEARSRLGKNAMRLAAPAVAADIHFVIESFDPDKNAFWLSAFVSFTLRNILQDEYYEDEIEIHVAPDKVPGVTEIGRLVESAVVCNEATPARVVHAYSCPISEEVGRYQAFVKVSIPPGAEAIHSYSFTGWSIRKVSWLFNPQRYTENLRFRVTNRSGMQVTCTLSRGTNNPTIAADVLATKKVGNSDEVLLKEDLVLSGNYDNLQMVIDT